VVNYCRSTTRILLNKAAKLVNGLSCCLGLVCK